MPDLPLWQRDGSGIASAIAAERGKRAQMMFQDVQRFLAPSEFEALLTSAADLEGYLAAWRRLLRQTGRRPRGFVRHGLAGGAHLYTDGRPRRGKVALVFMTGIKSRPGMPTPILLQHLDPARYDLLLLADPTRADYRHGIEGFAADLPDLARRIEEVFPPGRHAARLVIGQSKGGLPALRLAVLSGWGLAAAFGARPSNDALRLVQGTAVPPAFDPLCHCLQGRPLRAIAIHPERHAADRKSAQTLAAHPGIHAVALEGLSDHNLLEPLHQSLAIGPFFRSVVQTLLAPTPPAKRMARPVPAPAIRLRHALSRILFHLRRPNPRARG